jgi:hypothetical protein
MAGVVGPCEGRVKGMRQGECARRGSTELFRAGLRVRVR